MLTATVPITAGTFPEPADHGGAGVACLIDTAPDAGLDLPCRTNNPDLWFADAPAELEKAKTFCVGCPVIAECLAGALARHEPWGVWGGEIFERGAVIARKRPRGRPRKDAAPVAPAVPAAPAATVVRGATSQEAAA
ncbi:WhiB family transcriptional regulator [Umezawaea tangerina]|uniref:Transcriptional regulator WhiB n=1 Tax=Umezawaea tangerina TaxID=84725 RepID=A0A2T0S6X6_9PSEU|nr:WhiB family transcriptional regulator [Umezawaea tangerina]PRY29145.1 WhiB family redox-sensing transcriptional regulator [Umezawaea tangerina]